MVSRVRRTQGFTVALISHFAMAKRELQGAADVKKGDLLKASRTSQRYVEGALRRSRQMAKNIDEEDYVATRTAANGTRTTMQRSSACRKMFRTRRRHSLTSSACSQVSTAQGVREGAEPNVGRRGKQFDIMPAELVVKNIFGFELATGRFQQGVKVFTAWISERCGQFIFECRGRPSTRGIWKRRVVFLRRKWHSSEATRIRPPSEVFRISEDPQEGFNGSSQCHFLFKTSLAFAECARFSVVFLIFLSVSVRCTAWGGALFRYPMVG